MSEQQYQYRCIICKEPKNREEIIGIGLTPVCKNCFDLPDLEKTIPPSRQITEQLIDLMKENARRVDTSDYLTLKKAYENYVKAYDEAAKAIPEISTELQILRDEKAKFTDVINAEKRSYDDLKKSTDARINDLMKLRDTTDMEEILSLVVDRVVELNTAIQKGNAKLENNSIALESEIGKIQEEIQAIKSDIETANADVVETLKLEINNIRTENKQSAENMQNVIISEISKLNDGIDAMKTNNTNENRVNASEIRGIIDEKFAALKEGIENNSETSNDILEKLEFIYAVAEHDYDEKEKDKQAKDAKTIDTAKVAPPISDTPARVEKQVTEQPKEVETPEVDKPNNPVLNIPDKLLPDPDENDPEDEDDDPDSDEDEEQGKREQGKEESKPLTENQKKVLEYIKTNQNSTFKQIVEGILINKGTLSSNLKTLLDFSLVRKNEDDTYSG